MPNPETHTVMLEADVFANGRKARFATGNELFNALNNDAPYLMINHKIQICILITES